MKRTVVALALCAVGFGACGSGASEGGDVVVVDVDQAMRSAPRGLKVSDFVDSISFIPIYDGNTMYMGDPRLMTVTSDHIFVSDGANRLVGYNLRERTSWQIGTRGRGPGEYLRMDALVADEKSRVVYALIDDPKPGAIHKYDFDGGLVDIFPLEEDADNVGLTGDGHLVVLSSNYFGNSKHQFFVLNGQGRMVVDHPNPFFFTMVGPQGPTYNESVKYNHGGELHIKGKGDTLYRFS